MTKMRRKSQPEPIQNILRRWMQQHHNMEKEWQKYQIFRHWNQIVDERTRKHTKPWRFQGQVLEVMVDSAPYYFELSNFRKQSLLQKLQQTMLEIPIRNLCFICGNLPK